MPALKQKVEDRLDELVALLLQQHGTMQRMSLTSAEWISFKLGISQEQAERLVGKVRAQQLAERLVAQPLAPIYPSHCCGAETDFVARLGSKDRRRCRQCGGEDRY
jgi:hypothetical protein